MPKPSAVLALASLAVLNASASRAAMIAPDSRIRKAEPSAPKSENAKAVYRAIARKEAERAGLPYDLVDAVMKIESNYTPSVIGGVGEIGLMQVLPSTAEMLGFHAGTDDLADPATNIHYGATYLGRAWHLTKGNVCRTLMKYRAGHGSETMSPLSVTYCSRAKDHLAAVGSPLADRITAADLVVTAPVEAGGVSAPKEALPSLMITTNKGHSRPKTGQAFWTAFKARIAKANARIEAKWRHRNSRTASR